MVKRSKLLAVLLLLALALACLAGCGGTAAPQGGVEPSAGDEPAITDEPSAEDSPSTEDSAEATGRPAADGAEVEVIKAGLLAYNNLSTEEWDARWNGFRAQQGLEIPPAKGVSFDTLSSMLLALQAGQIDSFVIATAVADYIVAGNDALIIESFEALESDLPLQNALSMAALEDQAELLARLNDAIAALQADGTIDALVAAHIDGASPAAEPAAVAIPEIEGADTIKVAVTGDMPPIDFFTAAGEPAGFNVALLTALSQQAGVNIELVSVDAGARALALTSGRADVVFWMRSMISPNGTVNTALDAPPGVALTEPYYTATVSVVSRK